MLSLRDGYNLWWGGGGGGEGWHQSEILYFEILLVKRSHHHPTLLDVTCWPRSNTMEDVGLSLNLLKIFVQHRATLLAQQC